MFSVVTALHCDAKRTSNLQKLTGEFEGGTGSLKHPVNNANSYMSRSNSSINFPSLYSYTNVAVFAPFL